MSLDDPIASRKTALTVEEVAELLSVSKRLVDQLVSIGQIPYFVWDGTLEHSLRGERRGHTRGRFGISRVGELFLSQ